MTLDLGYHPGSPNLAKKALSSQHDMKYLENHHPNRDSVSAICPRIKVVKTNSTPPPNELRTVLIATERLAKIRM